VHLIMLAVMAGTMVAHSPLASIAGAAVLVAASVVCAALSRSRSHLREHVLDLWAMALVLVVLLAAETAGAAYRPSDRASASTASFASLSPTPVRSR
jgi:hypothetical protein